MAAGRLEGGGVAAGGLFPVRGRLCVSCPGCRSWRWARRAVRGRWTRAGRCGLRDGDGDRNGTACRGLALWKSLAGGKQQSGWEMELPSLP